MTWIALPSDDQVSGTVRRYFERVRSLFGLVPEIRRIFALRPDLVDSYFDFSTATLKGGVLSDYERELIHTVSAAKMKCTYCTVVHAEALEKMPDSKVDVVALLGDYRQAGLSPRDEAICAYAAKLTETPWAVSSDDVQALRAVGLNDAEIFDIALAVSYRNFISRMADGLGVELPRKFIDAVRSDPAKAGRYIVGKDLVHDARSENGHKE